MNITRTPQWASGASTANIMNITRTPQWALGLQVYKKHMPALVSEHLHNKRLDRLRYWPLGLQTFLGDGYEQGGS